MRTRKIHSVLRAFGCVLVFSSVCRAEVAVGVIVPLTGEMSLHGVEIRRSMELAARESRRPLRLIFEDNALDAKRSVAAAQKLIGSNRAKVLVTLWPPTAEAVIPISEREEILHYTIAWDPNLAIRNRFVLSHQAMVHNIVDETIALLKREEKRRPAFLHMEEAGFNFGASVFNSRVVDRSFDFVVQQSFLPTETDFRSTLARMHPKQIDSYVLLGGSALTRSLGKADSSARPLSLRYRLS